MVSLLSYCLKVSVSLALVSLFYYFVLRKLTFYNWNRYYLLGYSLLSFIVAFIDVSPVLYQNRWSDRAFVQWVPALTNRDVASATSSNPTFAASNVLGVLLILGIVMMSVRLLFQLLSLIRLKRKAEFIAIQGMKFYQVNDSIIPFSFGSSVFLNRNLHSEQELTEIVRHEFVHVKQRHSIDILWGELLCLVNWYNPFAWLLRASIRQNLEFIADNQVLENGIDKQEYQYMLLKVIGNNQFSIAQKFNFSSLKKRIAMMNKLKSARLNLVRFLFVLPLVIVLLLAFRNRGTKNLMAGKNDRVDVVIDKKARTDTIPKSAKEPQKGVIIEKSISALSDDYEITDDRAVIHLMDGTREEYDLKNKEQRKAFEDKYGKIINTKVHKGTMTTLSVVTTDGVVTAVAPVAVAMDQAPVKIITSGNGNGAGNGNGNGNNCVSVNSNVSAVVSVNPVSEKPVAVNVNAPVRTAVIAPVVTSETAVAIVGEGGNIIATTPEVLFAITKTTTPQQLEELRKQMKLKGFDLNFKETKYNADGKLVSISGTIESKDANARFASSTFNKLIVSVIHDGDRMYFRIDEVVKHVI